ncbi:MAG: hypothetical protein P4L92_03665 [Rudaea sp.]|nr:hypothetical protein [Rudaea sp.]
MAHASLLGVPLSLVVVVVFVMSITILLNNTIAGRRFVAVGANSRAAAAEGVRIVRYQIGCYALASGCFALAGMLLAGFIGFASQVAGNSYLLPGIAAVLVGGTMLGGGRGSTVASAVAALFMVQLDQFVLALGAGPADQLLVQAVAIVIATTIRLLPGLARRGKSHSYSG